MKLGIVGLGRMGSAIAQRVIAGGHQVIAFDLNVAALKEVELLGAEVAPTLEQLAQETRIIWLMLPAGQITEKTIDQLSPHLKNGDIIVDGGNSKFTDSIRRAQHLQKHEIFFLDCGTSGGLAGRALGFALMVGGDKDAYTKIHPILETIAAAGAVAHVGPAGAGHYVKMVHNGIEYALMQAYAEGFQLLKEGTFKANALDLEEISRVWNNGSVIRSWLLELAHDIFAKDQEFNDISGKIAQSGMGKWTVEDAHKNSVPVPCIEESLSVRDWSEKTGGNYATKLVALLRHAFGGHPVKKRGE